MHQSMDDVSQITWDMIVIGGGLVGAAVLREAVRLGLRVLLLEKNDFGSGASGILQQHFTGTWRAVSTHQGEMARRMTALQTQLQQGSHDLIAPVLLVEPRYAENPSVSMMTRLGQWARFGQAAHQPEMVEMRALNVLQPYLRRSETGAWQYSEMRTDGARLVWRAMDEAKNDPRGQCACLNYVYVARLYEDNQRVLGVFVQTPHDPNIEILIRGAVVIDATGRIGHSEHTLHPTFLPAIASRPVTYQETQIVLPIWRLPLMQGLSLYHPHDQQRLFLMPNENMALIQCQRLLNPTPNKSRSRRASHVDVLKANHQGNHAIQSTDSIHDVIDYALYGVNRAFSGLHLTRNDVLSVQNQRWQTHHPLEMPQHEAMVLRAPGWIGALISETLDFQRLAQRVLLAARAMQPLIPAIVRQESFFTPHSPPDYGMMPNLACLPRRFFTPLIARYGSHLSQYFSEIWQELLTPIPQTPYLWAELVWCAANEQIEHLDDLLLRRTRLGFFWPQGGSVYLSKIQNLLAPVLGWDDARWVQEWSRYQRIVARTVSVPPPAALGVA